MPTRHQVDSSLNKAGTLTKDGAGTEISRNAGFKNHNLEVDTPPGVQRPTVDGRLVAVAYTMADAAVDYQRLQLNKR
jgi:hypothetical protein